jgi:multiple sugar transport system ATP-binding protein
MVRLSDQLALPIPADRAARYRSSVGKSLTFGLRPEHITEVCSGAIDTRCEFPVKLDVVEPKGMRTMVPFSVQTT